MNTWPNGECRAISQCEHEKWNLKNYPGTRQVCALCGEPTGNCEENAFYSKSGEILCEKCYEKDVKMKECDKRHGTGYKEDGKEYCSFCEGYGYIKAKEK